MAPPQLATLAEEPGGEEDAAGRGRRRRKAGIHAALHRWAKARIPLRFLSGVGGGSGGDEGRRPSADLRVLLSVLACPLSPVPVLPLHPRNVASSAQYILEQFRATTGCGKMAEVKSMYAAGRVRMAMTPEPGGGGGHEGCFVVWQLVPDMWLVEMAVAGHAIAAGCDGRVAWRRTPWLGAHAARGGGARPLRRALQGLDPVTIASVFTAAEHVGEKSVDGEDCFALRLDVSPAVLAAWSDGAAEVIRHGITGYFSHRSGLLARLDDSQLTRIQPNPGSPALYWETTLSTRLADYRPVLLDAAGGGGVVVVAHAGTSVAHLARFGADVGTARAVTRMEEAWSIDDVAFNVAGLCPESFIAPEEVRGRGSSRRYDVYGGGGKRK
uniref:Uncharacterized protein n=1 Tax=Leersia perrieri TaxID=77586 RepID=A0A0D9XJM0_9ORYZ